MPTETTGVRQGPPGGRATGAGGHRRLLLGALLFLALGLPAPRAQGPAPGEGAGWFLYWVDEANSARTAVATDEGYAAMGSFATIWSRLYDPDKRTETTLQELYDGSSGGVATVSLTERNARGEVIRRFTERHPETKLVTAGDARTREGALLALLRADATDLKERQDAHDSLEKADKALRAASRQKPGGTGPQDRP